MIARLAQRLGFRPSVPVSLVDRWEAPLPDASPIEIGPRGARAVSQVDRFGRIQVGEDTWILDWTLAAGARWVASSQSERTRQRLVAPAVVETTVETPAGTIVQRVAAGVVDARPVAIVEFENTGSVAIAVGLVARPLRLDGRGHVGRAEIDQRGITIDGQPAVRFLSAPATVRAQDGRDGDLIQAMPAATDAVDSAKTRCRSGGAQAGGVWPLPHTATVRFVIEMVGTNQGFSTGPAPSTDDINRGWTTHLATGLRADIAEQPIADAVAIAARSLLTQWPEHGGQASHIVALSELGFGRDAIRLFEQLERVDSDAEVLRALARWAQLDPIDSADAMPYEFESCLGRAAQAAHVVHHAGGRLTGPGWLEGGLRTLADNLELIEQPEVAARLRSMVIEQTDNPIVRPEPDVPAQLLAELGDRGWSDSSRPAAESAATFVMSLRTQLLTEDGPHLQLLPVVPIRWRGRSIDVFSVPIAGGKISFGLRWHGPRPALLWQAELAATGSEPFRLTAPALDPGFSSSELQGEVLLADPGWDRT